MRTPLREISSTGDEIIVKAPKTKAGNRYVYFSGEMESLLREYEAFCAAETERYDKRKQTKDDYVFRRKGMKLPMTPSTFTWRFKKILKANDLPTDLNVHSLRHTAASLFIASGTDVGTVAGLLGHSQPSTTLDIYTHAFDKNKKAANARLNCPPFVRQYDILSNKWGVLLCQKEYQTNDIRRNSKNW